MIVNKIIVYVILFLALLGFLIITKIIVFRITPFVQQYILTHELNLQTRYGKDTYVLITGSSSGMGERFAHEFADRGFNLILVGSKRISKVITKIKKIHKYIDIIHIIKDFSKSFEPDFFDSIQKTVDDLGDKWTVLINNVGYRTSSIEYTTMNVEEMKKTISVGTLVQSKLIQMALQKFEKRKTHTSIVSIAAQNSFTTDLFALDNDITIPHLACYEATNAWGYFHAKSVYAEIKDVYPLVDFLIIMPGSVITKKTRPVLKDTILSVDVDTYIKSVMKFVGNYNGPICGHYYHSLSSVLINLFPFIDKESITKKVGENFAHNYKQ